MAESNLERPASKSRIVLITGQEARELQGSNITGRGLLAGIVSQLEVLARDPRLVKTSPFTPTPEPSTEARRAPTIRTSKRTLNLAKASLLNDPNSPEYLMGYMQAFWNSRRAIIGLSKKDILVADLPWSSEQIAQFRGLDALPDKAEGIRDMAGFIPEVVASDLTLVKKGFPEVQFYFYGGLGDISQVNKTYILAGWKRTEAEIDAPYARTTEQGLREKVDSLGRRGLNLNAYTVFGVLSRDLTGKYLDQTRTAVRLLGASFGGRVLGAKFSAFGRLDVYSYLDPQVQRSGWGGRSAVGGK